MVVLKSIQYKLWVVQLGRDGRADGWRLGAGAKVSWRATNYSEFPNTWDRVLFPIGGRVYAFNLQVFPFWKMLHRLPAI